MVLQVERAGRRARKEGRGFACAMLGVVLIWIVTFWLKFLVRAALSGLCG